MFQIYLPKNLRNFLPRPFHSHLFLYIFWEMNGWDFRFREKSLRIFFFLLRRSFLSGRSQIKNAATQSSIYLNLTSLYNPLNLILHLNGDLNLRRCSCREKNAFVEQDCCIIWPTYMEEYLIFQSFLPDLSKVDDTYIPNHASARLILPNPVSSSVAAALVVPATIANFQIHVWFELIHNITARPQVASRQRG